MHEEIPALQALFYYTPLIYYSITVEPLYTGHHWDCSKCPD